MIGKRLRETDLVGRRAVLLKTVSSANVTIPAGTVVEITRKYAGYTIKAQRCIGCGSDMVVTRVFGTSLELVEEDAYPEGYTTTAVDTALLSALYRELSFCGRGSVSEALLTHLDTLLPPQVDRQANVKHYLEQLETT